MKVTLTSVVCVVLSVFAASVEASAPGRVALWAGKAQPSSSHSEFITRSVDADNIKEHLAEFREKDSLIALLKTSRDSKPVFSHLHIIEAIGNAERSRVYSSLYHSPGASSSLENLQADQAFADAKEMTLANFHSHLKTAPRDELVGRPFVLTMQHDEEASLLQQVSDLSAEKNVPVTFVALDEPAGVAPLQHGYYHRVLAASSNIADGKYYSPEGAEFSIYYASTYLYITPDIFTGLLTALFCVFVFLIGYSCLGDIQGANTFPSKMPVIGKEA